MAEGLQSNKLWDLLVERTKELKLFKDVRRYNVHRAANADLFLRDLPDLVTPACLLVVGTQDDEVSGQRLRRHIRWSAIIIVNDESGKGARKATDLVDEFRDRILDVDLKRPETWVLGSGQTAPIAADPRFAIYEVGFRTRQQWLREAAA